MGLPPLFTPDDRINDGYLHLMYVLQFVLMVAIIVQRVSRMRRQAPWGARASKSAQRHVPLCYRLPHLVCCLSLVAMHVVVIFYDAVLKGQDVPWSEDATKGYYLVCDALATLMWALCAGLVLAEQRNQKHSGRLLRLWWIFNMLVAIGRFSSDLVVLVPHVEAESPVSQYQWTIVRLAGFAPAFVLGMIGCFAPDTPPVAEEPPVFTSSTSTFADPLLAGVGSTQGGLTPSAAPPEPATSDEPTVPYSAEAHASFASQLTFSYMSTLLGTGRKRALEHSDLFGLDDGDASLANEKLLAESLAKGGTFLRAWHRAYGSYFWATGALQLLNTACTFANPLLLNAIVKFISHPETSNLTHANAILLAVAMFGANCAKSLILGQYFWRGFRLGLRTRAAVGQVVYSKALNLAHEQRQAFGTGSIVSYMQIDAQKMADALPYMHLLWQGPLQLAIATYMLYDFMGPAGLSALGVLVISMPLNTWISKKTASYTKATMGARDKRVKFTNELLQGVKILKLFAWEPAMMDQLSEKRKVELVAVRKNMLMGGVMGFIFTALPLVVTATSFGLFAVPGLGKKTPDNPDGQLTAAIAFTALSLFQVLRFPLLVVPMMIARLMDLLVVDGRLTKFFRAPNRPVKRLTMAAPSSYEDFQPGQPLTLDDGLFHEPAAAPMGTDAVEMSGCTFKWPEPKEEDKDAKKKGKKGANGAAASANASTNASVHGGGSDRQPLTAGTTSSTAEASGGEPKPMLPPTLINLSLKLPQGGLVGIGGPVGSGKSTLLSALVGDVPCLSGRVVVRGTISLCTQEPWIQNQTVRDNITFGLPFDPAYYARVLSACALEADLAQLPGGDSTEIGERGVNLSGGQKARVALARACYARASIVLLDDVLAAVDAEVGAHLVQKCITGLLKERGALVIFVTHHVHWLHECDHVIMLDENGNCKAQGPPASISSLPRNSSSGKLSRDASVGSGLDAAGAPAGESSNGGGSASGSAEGGGANPAGAPKEPQTPGTKAATKLLADGEAKAKEAKAKGKQMSDEDRERGTVSRSVWVAYAKALGMFNVCFGIIGAAILSQALQFGSSFWLGVWAGDIAPNSTEYWTNGTWNGTAIVNQTLIVDYAEGSIFHDISGGEPWFYLAIYCAAASISAAFILLRSFVVAYASVHAGKKIHDTALAAVFASPSSWFDITPLGRIINRFSGDVQKVDVMLASSLSQFVSYFASLLCTLAIIVINSVYILLSLPPLGFAYVVCSSYYRNSAREIQRLDSISKSPIYAAFQEALNGATSIQAYGANTRFEETNRQKVDFNLRANYISLAANRWLTVRLEFFSNILLFLTALLAVVESINAAAISGASSPEERKAAALRAAAAGLALTYAPGLTDTLNFLIRQLTMLETQMVSVERLNNYASLEREGTSAALAAPLPPTWPTAGAIKFNDVRMGYRAGLPDVLKGMVLSVAAGEQIGIVGRTGAGKSSILVCLYRLAELRGGSIDIDGVDIATVPLPVLRSRLAIIPQDPVLFTGTLRSNLDPTSEMSDEALWASLRQAGMEAAMRQHPEGLLRPVEERGGNLSMGQRQLLCLCRALLKRARILVLDEATASVDMESDALIQQTLQHSMGGTTVLTIAHRLETIMHCDRVVVMHEGRVAESGPPQQLRAQEGSRFGELWEART